MEDQENEDDLFSCAICGVKEGDSSNLTSQNNLQTNATVRCGHQFCNSCIDRELSRRRVSAKLNVQSQINAVSPCV
jgi:hypothetical protein